MGHRLQLVLQDVLINGEYADPYRKYVGHLFQIMGEWQKDASGMKFKEIAAELLHPTLKQRSK